MSDTYSIALPPAPRWTRWTVSQRPSGLWSVRQADRQTGRINCAGVFATEAEAREVAADLNPTRRRAS